MGLTSKDIDGYEYATIFYRYYRYFSLLSKKQGHLSFGFTRNAPIYQALDLPIFSVLNLCFFSLGKLYGNRSSFVQKPRYGSIDKR